MKDSAVLAFIFLANLCYSQTTHNVTVQVNQQPTCHVVSTAAQTLEEPDIYPNPASGTLLIRGIERGSAIEIKDALSRPVFEDSSVSSDRLSIDVSALARGLYMVITKQRKKIYVTRLVLR